MCAYPTDEVLLARGKYSTLGKERREQLERVQKICTTLMNTASQILRDCEKRPPENESLLPLIETCWKNLGLSRQKLTEIAKEMNELQPQAWGDDVQP